MERKAWVEGSDHRLQNGIQVESELREVYKGKRAVVRRADREEMWSIHNDPPPPSSVSQVEMKTRWVAKIDFRVVEEWGQSKE